MEERTYHQLFFSQWKKPGFYFAAALVTVSNAILIMPSITLAVASIIVTALMLPFLEIRLAHMKGIWEKIPKKNNLSFIEKCNLFLEKGYFKLPEFWLISLLMIFSALTGNFVFTIVNIVILLLVPVVITNDRS